MKATFNEFTVSSTYTGSKAALWDESNYNHNRVTVWDIETRKRTSFDFWGSIANPELESEYDTLNAFYCFVSDALSGAETFPDFCREFGYDDDSRKARKAWNACRRSLAKLRRVSGYSDDEIYSLINELSEKYA